MNARATRGAGSEKTACSRCQALVYFDRSGAEAITRDWSSGVPHEQTCPDVKKPTSIHRDAKPAKVAPRQLITMQGESLMLIHPSKGGSLEIRRDEARWVLIGKAKKDLGGIHLDDEEFLLITAALSLWANGVNPVRMSTCIGESHG